MEQFIGYKALRPALDMLELRSKYQELLERKSNSKLGKEISDISLKITKLKKELKKVNRKIAKTKKRLDKISKEKNILWDLVAELKLDICYLEQQKDDLESDLNYLKWTRENKKTRKSLLDNALNGSIQSNKEELTKNKITLRNEIANLKKEENSIPVNGFYDGYLFTWNLYLYGLSQALINLNSSFEYGLEKDYLGSYYILKSLNEIMFFVQTIHQYCSLDKDFALIYNDFVDYLNRGFYYLFKTNDEAHDNICNEILYYYEVLNGYLTSHELFIEFTEISYYENMTNAIANLFGKLYNNDYSLNKKRLFSQKKKGDVRCGINE